MFISIISSSIVFSQAAWDDCADALANPLTVDGGLQCGFDLGTAGTEAGECLTNWAGAGNQTMWSAFTATNDSMVINYIETISDGEWLAVYGPNSGCQPPCADELAGSGQQIGDPGHHLLFTGLTVGATYLIQIDGADPGGPSVNDINFCIGVAEPSSNSSSSGATLVDECGVTFNNTTDGGYWQNGTSTGFNNLDANAGTTCGTCAAGDDTPFIINNVAWNYFCSLTGGTWTLTVDNITNCTLSSPNSGVQISIFTGTTGALVNEGNSASPQAPGSSYTSPTITVNAGECAYVMIDGFAGDVCDYSVTLTNITGGCSILSLEFLSFNAYKTESETILNWTISSESNNSHFIVERSFDGETFEVLGTVNSIGDHGSEYVYEFIDKRTFDSGVYYKLSSEDIEGNIEALAFKHIVGNGYDQFEDLTIYPNPSEDFINIKFMQEDLSSMATVLVYNSMGVELKSFTFKTEPGLNDIQMIIDDLDHGNYILKVISNNEVASRTFAKL